MSTINEVAALLENVPHLDKVYVHLIPESEVDTVNKTICLLRNVQVQTEEEANNRFNAINSQIQVQIFLKKDVDFDIEQLQVSLARLFESNHYESYTLGGWVADPDTEQLFNSIYVEKLKYVN